MRIKDKLKILSKRFFIMLISICVLTFTLGFLTACSKKEKESVGNTGNIVNEEKQDDTKEDQLKNSENNDDKLEEDTNGSNKDDKETTAVQKDTEKEEEPIEETNEEEAVETVNTNQDDNNDQTASPENLTDKISCILAEKEALPQLEKVIINEIGIDTESAKSTRYYYNYVDLNDDGIDEIFVQLVGPYTSGTGGDTAMIFKQGKNDLELIQTLTLIRNPIIISNQITNGWHELVFQASGGGIEATYIALKSDGEAYINIINNGKGDSIVNDSKVNIDDVSGTAIICDDMAKDMEEGKGLYLSK